MFTNSWKYGFGALAMLLPLLVTMTPASATPPEPDPIEQIRAIYQHAKEVEARPDARLFLMKRVRENELEPKWIMTDPLDNSEKFDAQFIGYADGREIVSAHLLESSPSGDWMKTTEFYFYDDGSTAFVFSSLQTFAGNVRVERRIYLNRAGKIIRELKSVFDLSTGAEKPDDPETYRDHPTWAVPSIHELFISLIAKG
jgi:hypothetical protein